MKGNAYFQVRRCKENGGNVYFKVMKWKELLTFEVRKCNENAYSNSSEYWIDWHY